MMFPYVTIVYTPPMKYECGESLGDLEPVYDLFPITSEFALPETDTDMYLASLWNKAHGESGDSYSE